MTLKLGITYVYFCTLVIIKTISNNIANGDEIGTLSAHYKMIPFASSMNDAILGEKMSAESLLSCSIICFKNKRPSFYYNQSDNICHCNSVSNCRIQTGVLADSEPTTSSTTYGFITKCSECDLLRIDNGYVEVLSNGSHAIGCNKGYMTSSGPNIEVIADCNENGTFENVACFSDN
ncbi:hypothetical protein ACF0H5_013999 [Mactra antiquata]